MSLNDTIKIDFWSEFKYVCATAKEIAEEARKEYRRKNKSLVSLLVVRPIKAILSPLSLLMNHRYSDEATINLLSSAVRKLNLLATDLEQHYETRYVDTIRELASTLVSFLSQYDGVQLELFDPYQYHVPVSSCPVTTCFKQWLSSLNWRTIEARIKAYKNTFTSLNFHQLEIAGLIIPSD
jgi:hypothetical protein